MPPKKNYAKKSYKRKSMPVKEKKEIVKLIKKEIKEDEQIYQVQNEVRASLITPNIYSNNGIDLLANAARGSGESFTSDLTNQEARGLNVRLQRVLVKGWATIVYSGASNLDSTSYILRVDLVVDEQASQGNNLVPYASATGLDNVIWMNNDIKSGFNHLARGKTGDGGRFRVLKSMTRKLNYFQSQIVEIDMNINLRNMLYTYYPTTPSYFELQKRLLLFVTCGGIGAATPVNVSVTWTSTVTFTNA